MSEAVFIADGDGGFRPTEIARGPWDPQAQHGGAPAALLMRAFEAVRAEHGSLPVARVTYEFLRPVPLDPLTLRVELSRPGRRVQLLEGSLYAPDGTEVVRARALLVRQAEADACSTDGFSFPGPADGRPSDMRPGSHAMFGTDAMEIRFVAGTFLNPGPATAWFRLRYPVVAGDPPSGLQRLAAAGDFGNGISAPVTWEDHLFINPDLTLYVEREPVGEWICLESVTRVSDEGVGVSDSVLYDERGRVGRALQALLVARR